MTVTRSVRRRIDYVVLRWQARLDAAWADRTLPWLGTIGLFVVLAAMSLARARSLETGDEMAVWVQGAWQVVEGIEPRSSITGRHLFEAQFAVGFWPVAQGTRLFAPIPYLLLLQSLALALGVPAVWHTCRRVCHLRVGAAMAAIVAYAAFPALHELNLTDFRPEVLALPALMWGSHLAYRDRWRWAIPLFVVAVSMRSDLGLTVAAIGLGLWWAGRGRGGRRMAVLGVAWTLLAHLVLQPWVGDGSFAHEDAFARFGDGPLEVVWGMVTRPWDLVVALTARENFVLTMALLAPVGFLPLLAPRRVLPFLPVLGLFFVADLPTQGPILVPAVVGAFVCLPFALERLGRRNIERVTVDHRLLSGLGLASLAFFVLLSPSSPYESPWEWGGRDAVDRARLDAIDAVADDERVRASSTVVAELAERRVIRTVERDGPPDGSDLAEGVDVVVLGPEVVRTRTFEALAFELEPEDDDAPIRPWEGALFDEGFELVSEVQGVLVYRRP